MPSKVIFHQTPLNPLKKNTYAANDKNEIYTHVHIKQNKKQIKHQRKKLEKNKKKTKQQKKISGQQNN